MRKLRVAASVLMVLAVLPGFGVAQELQKRGSPELQKKGTVREPLPKAEPKREELQQAVETWACDATITLAESSHDYSPQTWLMSGSPGVDREKKCKEHIQEKWLNNNAIWKLLRMSAREQNTWCQRKGGSTVRVDYGFDKAESGQSVSRPGHTKKKDRSFTQTVTVSCIFDLSMSSRL